MHIVIALVRLKGMTWNFGAIGNLFGKLWCLQCKFKDYLYVVEYLLSAMKFVLEALS